jgi:hypothetical protein
MMLPTLNDPMRTRGPQLPGSPEASPGIHGRRYRGVRCTGTKARTGKPCKMPPRVGKVTCAAHSDDPADRGRMEAAWAAAHLGSRPTYKQHYASAEQLETDTRIAPQVNSSCLACATGYIVAEFANDRVCTGCGRRWWAGTPEDGPSAVIAGLS